MQLGLPRFASQRMNNLCRQNGGAGGGGGEGGLPVGVVLLNLRHWSFATHTALVQQLIDGQGALITQCVMCSFVMRLKVTPQPHRAVPCQPAQQLSTWQDTSCLGDSHQALRLLGFRQHLKGTFEDTALQLLLGLAWPDRGWGWLWAWGLADRRGALLG